MLCIYRRSRNFTIAAFRRLIGKDLHVRQVCLRTNMAKELRVDAMAIFNAAVKAVCPEEVVKNALKFDGTTLFVQDKPYRVANNVHIAAFGKAVLGMTRAVESVLGNHVQAGVASIPYGLQKDVKSSGIQDLIKTLLEVSNSKVKIIEGAKDNLPDEAAHSAALEIIKLAESLGENDLLIVLMSGGGSALLPAPVHPVTLEEKLETTKILGSQGATINQLNTIRKNLSMVKGGGLARIAKPAKVISLILSDVIGDPLDIIASGPTVPDSSTPKECLEIIRSLNAENMIPPSVLNYLRAGESNDEKQVQEDYSNFSHVQNVIVGSNVLATRAAATTAKELGYEEFIISHSLSGEARNIGNFYAHFASLGLVNNAQAWLQGSHLTDKETIQRIAAAITEKKRVCVIGAGEPTVTVKGTGKGGRNQELALAAGIAMQKINCMEKVLLLSAGTDGQDGPTRAAGAFAYPGQVQNALNSGLDAQKFLENNDSNGFFSQSYDCLDLVITGMTGTNVMDLHIFLMDAS